MLLMVKAMQPEERMLNSNVDENINSGVKLPPPSPPSAGAMQSNGISSGMLASFVSVSAEGSVGKPPSESPSAQDTSEPLRKKPRQEHNQFSRPTDIGKQICCA
jgi:hypothetical protein